MTNKQQQQQFDKIARDPLAFLIKAVGGTSKPRPCDENDHVAFTPSVHAKLVRQVRAQCKAGYRPAPAAIARMRNWTPLRRKGAQQ